MTPAFPPLEHYSDNRVERVDSREQWDPHAYMKPRGLWVSVPGEYDWPTWCRENDFGLPHFQNRHQVQLVPRAKILWLQSPTDIDSFTYRYGVEDHGVSMIAWGSVAAEYDGILISPYQWSRRLQCQSSIWYYGWDCASGCIWNAGAVASIELLPPFVFLEPAEGDAHAN